MKTGALAIFDALGVKGIWEKHDAAMVIEKLEAMDALGRDIVDRDYGGPGHPRLADAANCIAMVRVGFLSDTVVVAVVNKEQQSPHFAVMMAARYAGDLRGLVSSSRQPGRTAASSRTATSRSTSVATSSSGRRWIALPPTTSAPTPPSCG